MDLVLPAQLIIISVLVFLTKEDILYGISALGQQILPGILIFSYSSNGRPSKIMRSFFCCCLLNNSFEVIDGVLYLCSTSSPKLLLGTLIPSNNSKPSFNQPSIPFSKIKIFA